MEGFNEVSTGSCHFGSSSDENREARERFCKVWNYSEEKGNRTVEHTISVTNDRFTHESRISKGSGFMRERTDLSLRDVNSVKSFFGVSRNILGVVLLAIASVIFLILAFKNIVSESSSTKVGVVFLIIALAFAALAVWLYTRIKPAFMLEIETVIHNGTLKQSSLSYGSISLDVGKKNHSALFYVFLVLCWPLGIIYLIAKSGGNGGKYKFIMDEAVGNEIVDTIGDLLIRK